MFKKTKLNKTVKTTKQMLPAKTSKQTHATRLTHDDSDFVTRQSVTQKWTWQPTYPDYPTRTVLSKSSRCMGGHSLLVCSHSQTELSVTSVEPAAAQIVGNDDVSNGIKHKLNVVSVCRTSLVAVNFLRCALILRFELSLDVRSRLLVTLLAWSTLFTNV